MNNKKTVIITGGANGIGKETAFLLHKNNYNISVVDIDKKAGSALASGFSSEDFLFMTGNISDINTLDEFLKKTINKFGGVYALVNNAAVSTPEFNDDLAKWEKVMAVNLRAPFYLSKKCAPYLKKQRGAIVNIASTRALMSQANTEAYSASKGGLLSLTHSLAASLSPEIRVNAISPGWIHTGPEEYSEKLSEEDHSQHLTGRVGRPSDIAEMVSYLISSKAEFITGQNFIIDGGMTRKMIYC
ncbi:MAG: SDR family oxidoreductase [Spirochaetia bacterium]|nr:SDR family oxidoreductase [Spirochaetia bacterium]